MNHTDCWPATVLLLVACSSGTGGETSPIGPEPQDSTTSSSATGTGGGPSEELNYQTANNFANGLPGEYDSSRQSEQDPSLEPKHFWACRLDAPELGERVVYLERSELETIDSPYVQLIISINAISGEYDRATAKLYVPDELGPWVGLCEGGPGQAMPTAVQELVGCDTMVSDDHTTSIWMESSGASCIPNAPEGTETGSNFFRLSSPGVIWRDEFRMEDGSLVLDPTGAPDARPEYALDRLGEAGQ